MPKKYIVTLTETERTTLHALIASGKGAARRLAHARILLKAADGLPDTEIAAAVEVSIPTVERVRRRVVEEGLEAALDPRPPTSRLPTFDGPPEAPLVAPGLCPPPPGTRPRSLHLPAAQTVAMA